MRSVALRPRPWPVAAAAALGAVALSCSTASGFFTATGAGTAAAGTGALSAPSIGSATPGAGTVALVWSTIPSPSGPDPVRYSVRLDGGSVVFKSTPSTSAIQQVNGGGFEVAAGA